MVVRSVIAGVLASVLLSLGVAAWAQSEEPAQQGYVFDIPRLPVIEALKEFIVQTGLQVSFWPDAKTDQTLLLGPLKGKFTAEAALAKLLESSGLAFQRTNDRSLVVMAPSLFGAPRNGVGVSDKDKKPEDLPHLRPQHQPPTPMSVAGGKAGSAADAGANSGAPLDEVIVTGSRLERSGEGPAPVQVFNRDDIERLGAVSIPDVLRYTPQQPFSRAEHYYHNGAQYSQMRGIGVDTTLVLINGRRVVPTSNSLTLNAFDLNSIPLAAVEKVEVLSDSASAIYGADALGGVVNVVLKKEIPQPILDVQYGGAQGGADLRRASLSTGYATDRLRSSLIFDYYERDFLFGAERDRWSDQDFRRYGGRDYRSAAGSPGTVRSLDGANLPGLSASSAMVPYGSSGIGMTPQDFVATAGMHNPSNTLTSLSIVPEAHQRSAVLSLDFDMTANLTAFTQLLYTNRETISQDEMYAVQGALVPATNPFNPFQQPVLVDFLLTGIESRRFVHDLEMARGVAGLRGLLGSWQWEVSATASTETDDAFGENQVSLARVNAALAATDAARALNPFADGPAGSPELLSSLVEPNQHHHFSRGRQLSAFMRGSLFELPAGSVDAVVGGEWRDEAIIYDDLTQAVRDRRDASAAFTELSVPLISRTPYSRGDVLAMTLAARLDDYSDFGSTVNPQFGLMWRPVPDLLVRGSYGTSFRPPSLFELHLPRSAVSNVTLQDPARNNATTRVSFLIGGNPQLRPIEADSMTAGFVLTPDAIPGLRLLSNYWRISTDHRVTVLPFASLLAHEANFSDRVLRAAPTPEDIAAGIPGRLMQLDLSRMNFGRLTTSGIDVEVGYEFATSLGRFTQRVAATWVDEFTSEDLPTTAPIDRVGIANAAGSIPRWRVVGTLGWKRNGVGLSTTVDWLPAYMDADANGLTGRQLPDRTLVDVQASFAMDELLGPGALWNDLKLQTGVKNVFDEQPPFSDIGFAIGFDSSQGDLIGRFGYIKLSKGF
jgi:iron complex outermembrane receptor protein